MGDPGIPTEVEREFTLARAHKIVAAVREDTFVRLRNVLDEMYSSEVWRDVEVAEELDRTDDEMFRLAQDLVDANAELERMRRVCDAARDWRQRFMTFEGSYFDCETALIKASDELELVRRGS